MADWILILFRWLIAMPIAPAVPGDRWPSWPVSLRRWAAVRRGWRRWERESFARKLPHLPRIGWMTYCLGPGWTSTPPGLVPAMASGAPPGFKILPWQGLRHRAPGFIHNDHLLSCPECVPGPKVPPWGIGSLDRLLDARIRRRSLIGGPCDAPVRMPAVTSPTL